MNIAPAIWPGASLPHAVVVAYPVSIAPTTDRECQWKIRIIGNFTIYFWPQRTSALIADAAEIKVAHCPIVNELSWVNLICRKRLPNTDLSAPGSAVSRAVISLSPLPQKQGSTAVSLQSHALLSGKLRRHSAKTGLSRVGGDFAMQPLSPPFP